MEIIMLNIKNKLSKYQLFLSKIIFSLYNLIIILVLNLFFDQNLAGKLLYIQGMIFIFSAISRLGSDYYWVSSTNNSLVVSRYELLIILASSVISSLACYYILNESNIINLIWIFISIILNNVINFIGRIYQKKEKHVLSLFMFVLAPTVLVVPILWFYKDFNIYILLSLSMSIILIMVLFIEKININFELESNFFKRLNYLPITIYGMINQNLISTIGGLINKEEQIALLVLFQRLTGLVLWPQIFHMQKNINKINEALINKDFFTQYLIKYIQNNFKQIILYSLLSLFVGSMILFKMKGLNIYTFLSLNIILFAGIINVFLGYLQVQIGKSNNGLVSSYVILLSMVMIYLFINIFNLDYITIALAYFLFHLINHISNYFILIKWFKK